MKSIYITLQDFDDINHQGVNNKIKDQVTAFNKYGFRMEYIGVEKNNVVVFNTNNEKKILDNFDSKLSKRRKILLKSSEYIINNKIDYIYIRYFKSDKLFIKFLKDIRKYVKKIDLEIATYPYECEVVKKFSIQNILAQVDKHYRKFLYKYIDNIITFSSDKKIFSIPTIQIENGIDIDRIKKRNYKKKENIINYTMIGVANLNFWHGYDRVIRGLGEYYKIDQNKKVIFNIVGNGKELNNLKKMVIGLGISEYVKFKGSKSGNDLDEEFNNADIAIGSLGIHRLGLKNVSTLKLKEYIARGIPFIYAYNDNAIDNNFKYAKKELNDESTINIKRILEFYDYIFNESLIEEMREISKKFTWEVQVKKIIDIYMHNKNY